MADTEGKGDSAAARANWPGLALEVTRKHGTTLRPSPYTPNTRANTHCSHPLVLRGFEEREKEEEEVFLN